MSRDHNRGLGSWIRRSGQLWKLVTFALLGSVSFASFVAMVLTINGVKLVPLGEGALAFVGVIVGTADFAWLCLSIRCPRCGARPAWKILRTSSVNSWFVELCSMTACPACGEQ